MNLSDLFPYWPALRPAFGTVSSIPTTPAPGATYQISAYPGSRLYTNASGKLEGYLGMLTYADALLIPTDSLAAIGVELRIINPLSPRGWTQFNFISGALRPSGKQILAQFANSDGSPLLSLADANALAIGAWNEVWTSPILPVWMAQSGRYISVHADGEIKDASSVAVEKMRIAIRGAAFGGGDENDGLLGHSGTGTPYGRGLGAGARIAHVVGSSVIGTQALSAYNTASQPRRVLGTLIANGNRLRLEVWPGAATNVISLWGVTLGVE